MLHPYRHERIGLATIHGKHLAVAPPFRRVLGAEIVTAPDVDTDTLGTFSGEIARPAPVVETCALKAELAFQTMDVDCAIASEGSYGPIDSLPFNPAGVEIMAFVDRRRGLRLIETMGTHRTNWRLLSFRAGDPGVRAAATAIGFPDYGVFVICNSDRSRPIMGLASLDEIAAAVDREAERSEDGTAILIADMRAHCNPTRMKVLRALAYKLARRLERLCPKCGTPGFGHIESRRGLPCESCSAPTHWIDFEVDGCSVCGHAETRPRKDGRTTASKLSCRACRPS